MTLSFRIITGITLLFANIPFGLGGFAYFVYLGRKTKNKFFYYVAFITYFFSWLMLFAGIYLCGETYSKHIIKNYVVKYTYWLIGIFLLIFFIIFFLRRQIFKKLIKISFLKKSKKH